MEDIIERLKCCLTESSHNANVGNILYEFTLPQIEQVLEYLVSSYSERKFLLEKFWNHKSDACPVDSEVQEEQIIEFRRFVSDL